MSRRILISALALYVGCALSSEAAINRSVKTKHDSRTAAISRVCLVSLDAQIQRLGMKGLEPLLPESEVWAGKLHEMLTHSVTGAGWTITGDLTEKDSNTSEQMRQTALRVRQKYDSIAVQLNRKPGKVEKGRYTLTDEVALLPCSAEADSLIFMDAAATLQTGSRKAFSFVIGGAAGILMAQSGYRIWIALVDAKTGEVTAFTRITLMGGKTGNDPDAVLSQRLVEEFTKLHPVAARR